jgi:hypothetical protein
MDQLIKKIKKSIKRFRSIKWTFSKAVILAVVLLVLFGLTNLILTLQNRDNLPPVDFKEVVIGGVTVATYDILELKPGATQRVIDVYVGDINTISGEDIKRITNNILLREGFRLNEVFINLKQLSDTNKLGYDSFPEVPTFDPTDLSTVGFGNESLIHTDDTDTSGLDFVKYVRSVQPRTDDFDVYEKDTNLYLIVLKNGYTEALFRSEFLADFSNTSGLTFEFKRKTDLVAE